VQGWLAPSLFWRQNKEVERRGEGETVKGTVVHAYIPEK